MIANAIRARRLLTPRFMSTAITGLVPSGISTVSINDECLQLCRNDQETAAASVAHVPARLELLKSYYDKLIVPAFPIQKQRDSLESFIARFRNQLDRYGAKKAPQETLDVVIFVDEDDEEAATDSSKCIVGGSVVEYYPSIQLGLYAYGVMHPEHQCKNIAKRLFFESLARIESLSLQYSSATTPEEEECRTTSSPLRAIFAEALTVNEKEENPKRTLTRQIILYRMGFRLVKFPFAQPPLNSKDHSDETYDDLALLVWFPFEQAPPVHDRELKSKERAMLDKYCRWYQQQQIADGKIGPKSVELDSSLPLEYVEKLYQSTFGEKCCGYKNSTYFKSVQDFAADNRTVEVSLLPPPWSKQS